MKTYEFTLKHDGGLVTLRIKDDNLTSATKTVLDIEKAPSVAIVSWRIVPTARQIRRTQTLLRGL